MLHTDCRSAPPSALPLLGFPELSVYGNQILFPCRTCISPLRRTKYTKSSSFGEKLRNTSTSRAEAMRSITQRRRCFAVGDIRHIRLGNLNQFRKFGNRYPFRLAYIFYSQYHSYLIRYYIVCKYSFYSLFQYKNRKIFSVYIFIQYICIVIIQYDIINNYYHPHRNDAENDGRSKEVARSCQQVSHRPNQYVVPRHRRRQYM